MDSFTLGAGRCWIIHAFGRNALVRPSDRFEALLTVLLVLAGMLFTPVACAIGTTVHDSRSRVYAQEATSHHLVSARLIDDSTATFEHVRVAATAPVRWKIGDNDHVSTVFVDLGAKAGDHVDIWVDAAGDYVSAPSARWLAGRDAFLAGIGAWLGAVIMTGGAWVAMRKWLSGLRGRGWDRELHLVVNDDGGRAGRQS